MLPDLSGLIYFAVFGMICAAAAALIGIPWLAWVLIHHLLSWGA